MRCSRCNCICDNGPCTGYLVWTEASSKYLPVCISCITDSDVKYTYTIQTINSIKNFGYK